MRSFIILFCFSWSLVSFAQTSAPVSSLEGTYHAVYGGDQLTLVIAPPAGLTYTGQMTDSYQSYAITLTRTGTTVEGSAVEKTLGLEFSITGNYTQHQLQLQFLIDIMGVANTMDMVFIKEGAAPPNTADRSSQQAAVMVFPAEAQHPADLLGTWTKEELYQSGYGDAAMGAGFSQSMSFLPGGKMAEGGSHAYISGRDYSGQSSGQGGGIIPGLAWYTIENQLYLQVVENERTQNIHLGKFFVENGRMLITGTNGEKVLLTKK